MGNNLCQYNPTNNSMDNGDDDDDGTNQLSVEYDSRMVLIINWTHRCTVIFIGDCDDCRGGVDETASLVT